MNGPLVVFVCAGTPTAGAGHLSRCLALADVYRRAGWRVELVVPDEEFAGLFATDCSWHVATPAKTVGVIKAIAPEGCDLLIVDDYVHDEIFESDCMDIARRIVAFDDQTGRRHRCDMLIDASASDPSGYHGLVESSTRILFGPKYALIRAGILEHRLAAIAARRARKVANVLVSFGATDPSGLTLKTIDAIAATLSEGITITAALSSRAPAIDAVRSRASPRIRLLVDASMGEVLAAADLAVGAGGVGAFERAALGLPGIVVTTAENQRGVARLLVEAGASLDGGVPDEDFAARVVRQLVALAGDADLRTGMSSASAAVVDGRAADRIHLASAAGTRTSAGDEVFLRAAEPEDADWLLALQREPATRRFARNPAPPSREQHVRWLAAVFERDSCKLAIIESNGAPVGMIRLDRSESTTEVQLQYEVSIAISAAFHGRGIGSAALRLIRVLYPGVIFNAFVFPENETSLRMFVRAGYVASGNGNYRNVPRHPRAQEP
jgi:UDP-2,4-diacetamido-2,4,6-trideoxy-beta-L-altropyranose hydrolase